MGVNLTPIIVKKTLSLEDLRGRSMAVDAFNVLHQFLALIRSRDGRPLSDREGRVTSHLVGLAFRTTRLIADHKMKLVFVFDGRPPTLKRGEVERRRALKRKAEAEYAEALEAGDIATAFSKAVQTGRLTSEMIGDAKRLLDLLGVPWVQAPGEGEAQAAYMALKGDVWAASTRDYDSLLFGAPRLVRYLTIQGREWLPSKGRSRKLEPELIELNAFLGHHGITREQLVDLAILVGTDFNQGLKGIGPKTALKLVREHGRLEEMPEEVASRLPEEFNQIRKIYLEPDITDDYETEGGALDEEGLYSFLCGERAFSRDRVETVVERMRRSQQQRDLTDWMRGGA
ncbi:flap endonuclease-1 [Candidatus Bathyarchaeota archaeon]|nr:MAG: flap endonuclease-1 [Candidatus Bathyarchaeota archaeon]